MFSSIKPKLDGHLFVGLGVFTHSYLVLPVANPQLFFRTILGSQQVKQVRIGKKVKNIEINKQSVLIFWPN